MSLTLSKDEAYPLLKKWQAETQGSCIFVDGVDLKDTYVWLVHCLSEALEESSPESKYIKV